MALLPTVEEIFVMAQEVELDLRVFTNILLLGSSNGAYVLLKRLRVVIDCGN